MIVDFFIDQAVGFAEWFMSLFDGLQVPDWVVSFAGFVRQITGVFSGLGVWVPWNVILPVVVVLLALWVSLFIFKLVKQLLAHFPAIGGAG